MHPSADTIWASVAKEDIMRVEDSWREVRIGIQWIVRLTKMQNQPEVVFFPEVFLTNFDNNKIARDKKLPYMAGKGVSWGPETVDVCFSRSATISSVENYLLNSTDSMKHHVTWQQHQKPFICSLNLTIPITFIATPCYTSPSCLQSPLSCHFTWQSHPHQHQITLYPKATTPLRNLNWTPKLNNPKAAPCP